MKENNSDLEDVKPDAEEKVSERQFPILLKKIISQYRIRNSDIAEAMHVTPQYVSKFLCGSNLPNRQQITKIIDCLTKHNVPVEMRRQLISSFVEDKTGFFYEIPDLEFNAKDQWEKKLLTDFRLLNQDSKKEIFAHISRLLIDSL